MSVSVVEGAADPAFPNRQPAVVRDDKPICTMVVDAEEDFDWLTPSFGIKHTTANMRNVSILQEIVGAYGLVPTYLLTYPILEVPEVVQMLRRRVNRGECEVGVQLHPWVTPPFEGTKEPANTFAGNLAPGIEERKLTELTRKFVDCFGFRPTMYRAGRYGFGLHSATLLERLGFTIDTSVAPRTTFTQEGGPDFTGYAYQPFWFGSRSQLLELPLCREIVGWGGTRGPSIYRAVTQPSFAGVHAAAVAARLRCAERITLSPEGNDLPSVTRLVNRLYLAGHRIFVLSFHSSSLAVGQNPYVQTKSEMHHFYDRLSGMLDFMAGRYSMCFSRLSQIPEFLQPPVRSATP